MNLLFRYAFHFGWAILLLGYPATSLFAADDPQAVPCSVNADSILHGDERFSPLNLFDGDTTSTKSRWASARNPKTHWVSLRFNMPIALDRVVVSGHAGEELALANAQIEVSDDGKSWRTVAKVSQNQKAEIDFRFKEQQTQQVRLYITKPCRADHTARLMEIKLYRRGTPIVLRAELSSALASIIGSRPGPIAYPHVDDAELLESVAPFPVSALTAEKGSARNHITLQGYYDAVLDWAQVATSQLKPVPGHPDWAYFGDGNHGEDSVRPLNYAVLINAFISQAQPSQGAASEELREQLQKEAIAILRYLTYSHCTGKGTCLNGKPWGNQWQSAAWTRSLGLGGWILWEKLDTPMKLAVARVVEFEADRFIAMPPKSGLFNDTGAEENAWNSGLLALATVMMPKHPRSKQWDQAAKRYMYNTFSVEGDKKNRTVGDDGRMVCDWITTTNAHADYTVENHGLVHIGYLKNSHAMLLEAISVYGLTDVPIPQAGLHHAEDVFKVLLKCMGDDGAPIYFGGNDWKLVHTQGSDVINYCMMNLLLNNPLAAYLEPIALDWTQRIQKTQKGHFNDRRDMEYGGLVASRLISCYLVHAKRGPGCQPVKQAEFQKNISGTLLLERGSAILHRTPSKFASFAWGRARMGLALGKSGTWTHWPHFSSYLGMINSQSTRSKTCRVKSIQYDVQPDRFRVVGSLERGGKISQGGVVQDFAFLSPPGDMVVYIERLRYQPGKLKSRKTGIVGLEYPLGENEVAIYGSFGEATLHGIEKKARSHSWTGNWLNVANQIGYVICRSSGKENLISYSDMANGSGRVPKLQEWISLIGDSSPATYRSDGTQSGELHDWACMVTFLNQSSKKTHHRAQKVHFDYHADVATCRIGADIFQVDFSQEELLQQNVSTKNLSRN